MVLCATMINRRFFVKGNVTAIACFPQTRAFQHRAVPSEPPHAVPLKCDLGALQVVQASAGQASDTKRMLVKKAVNNHFVIYRYCCTITSEKLPRSSEDPMGKKNHHEEELAVSFISWGTVSQQLWPPPFGLFFCKY